MTDRRSPVEALLARVGGVRGLIHTSLPVTVFAAVSGTFGLQPAVIASLATAAAVLVWQLARKESLRPSLHGFTTVVVCAAFALVTGRTKDFYLPGIWTYLVLGIVFTISLVVRWPLIGVGFAWFTGRDTTWRRTPAVRRAFDLATAVMAIASWTRFLVQYHFYDTDQEGLLAIARIAMGWPIFLLTSTVIYLSVRRALRALPRTRAEGDEARA